MWNLSASATFATVFTDCACVESIFGENCPKSRTLCVLNLSVSATFATVFTNGSLRDILFIFDGIIQSSLNSVRMMHN